MTGRQVRVKLCGINDPAAFDAAVEMAADWIGFVFFAGSPRALTPVQAAALSSRHAGGPLRVGLFVSPSEADIDAALDRVRLDVLQLYVPPARAAELGALFALPVWHPVAVASRADLPSPRAGIDGWVIESRPPAGATRPGGNAARFDWRITHGWQAGLPWLLAGGLTPDNVGAALRESGASAVDTSSGIESAPGVKDPARIRAFVRAARAGFTAGQTALEEAP